MNPTTFPPLVLPSRWTGLSFKTKEGYSVRVTDPRALRSKDLKSSPVNAESESASLYAWEVDGIPALICSREQYLQLRGVLK